MVAVLLDFLLLVSFEVTFFDLTPAPLSALGLLLCTMTKHAREELIFNDIPPNIEVNYVHLTAQLLVQVRTGETRGQEQPGYQ